MIYITGDCHQNFRKFNTKIFPEQKEMTKEDYVIICGDFGGVWNKEVENKEEKHKTWLIPSAAKKPDDARVKTGKYIKEKGE